MRVIPVNPAVREAKLIRELPSRRNSRLSQWGSAIVVVVQPDSMPVQRRWLWQTIAQQHRDPGAADHVDQRAWLLAVESEHGVAPTVERPAHKAALKP